MTRYRSLALEFRLRCTFEDPLARRVAELYRACESAGTGAVDLEITIDRDDASAYVLGVDDRVVRTTGDPDDLVAWLAWSVNRSAVERTERDLLVLHGAGVRIDARAVLIVGPSGAGKSTLVTALTLAGLEYLGEESLSLAANGSDVAANPKPIALDEASRLALAAYSPTTAELTNARQLFAPDALGPAAGPGTTAHPALIIRPAFRAGAGARASAMTRAEAAVLLADQSFNFAMHGRDALHAVAAIARAAPAHTLEFDDLAAAVALVRALYDATSPVRAVTRDENGGRAGNGGAADDLAVEMLDGEAVIWDPAHDALHHLSPSATTIWNAVRSGASPSATSEAIAHDTNRDRVEVASEVDGCIADLVARELLR